MKESKALILKTWNDIEFTLFIAGDKSKDKSHIYYQFKDELSGKKKRIRDGNGLTSAKLTPKQLKENAIRLIDIHVHLLESGYNPITGEITNKISNLTKNSSITECGENWLKNRFEAKENNAITEKTYDNYKYLINTHLREWLEKNKFQYRKVSSFTKIDIENFLQATAKEKDWGKVSYNCYRTNLGTFFNYLITLKVITENPANLTEKKNIKKDSSRFKIYEKDELRDVLSKLTEELEAGDKNNGRFFGLYVAAKILFKYNIRPIEILRIQIMDIDFDKGLLVLSPEKTKNGNEARFNLDNETLELFKKAAGTAPAEYHLIGGRNKPSKNMQCDDYLGQRFRIFRKEYGFKYHLKLYSLKHSSNYYDLQSGASFTEIQQRNRHANLQVTTLYIKERLLKDVIKPSESDLF